MAQRLLGHSRWLCRLRGTCTSGAAACTSGAAAAATLATDAAVTLATDAAAAATARLLLCAEVLRPMHGRRRLRHGLCCRV